MNNKVSIDDIIDCLFADRSFTETLKEFIEGRFEEHPLFLKHQLDITLENALRRLSSQEEDAFEARARVVNE